MRPAAAIPIGGWLVAALPVALASGKGARLAASARVSLISIAGPAVGPSLVSSEPAALESALAGWMLMRWTRNDSAMTTHTSTEPHPVQRASSPGRSFASVGPADQGT